jgi:hypothetical protein
MTRSAPSKRNEKSSPQATPNATATQAKKRTTKNRTRQQHPEENLETIVTLEGLVANVTEKRRAFLGVVGYNIFRGSAPYGGFALQARNDLYDALSALNQEMNSLPMNFLPRAAKKPRAVFTQGCEALSVMDTYQQEMQRLVEEGELPPEALLQKTMYES